MDQVAKRLSELQQVTGESDVESSLRALLGACCLYGLWCLVGIGFGVVGLSKP